MRLTTDRERDKPPPLRRCRLYIYLATQSNIAKRLFAIDSECPFAVDYGQEVEALFLLIPVEFPAACYECLACSLPFGIVNQFIDIELKTTYRCPFCPPYECLGVVVHTHRGSA